MEALGLDVKLLIAQVINFLILFFVLSKLLYKPLLKILDERKRKVEDSLKSAKMIEEKLAKLEEKEKEILKSAVSKAEEEKGRIVEIAQEEKKRIISEAKQAGEKEVQKAIERIKAGEEVSRENLKKEFVDEVVNELTVKFSKEKNLKNYPLLKEILK
jgi:F-type H+-transporting ATPase subunit b